jgi:hypothetical protein
MNTRPLNIANTLPDVLAWLDRMAETGMLKPNSARFKKTAIERLTSVMASEEIQTPEWVLEHVEELGNRWANIEKAKPDTVRTYMSRAKTALEDYLRYTADPASFKPQGRPSARTEKSEKKKAARPQPERSRDDAGSPAPGRRPPGENWRTFPLGKAREDFMYLLPKDQFTAKDVLKITCHLVTLAEDFDPTSPSQAQMFALARRGEEGT